MARVAVLSVSDGRPAVHADIAGFVAESQRRLTVALAGLGHEVIEADEIVCRSELAVAGARQLAAARPDLTIVNIAVWAFPHFTVQAARETDSPLLLFSNVDPQYPGMVGMLAAGGALDQIGYVHRRAWGDASDPTVAATLDAHARAGAATRRLRGLTFGRIGGRPMGMNTTVAPTDQWIREFGIDVEEIDQWELVRQAGLVEAGRVAEGRKWLERTAAGVHYDGNLLTPELLERQIAVYHGMQSLIDTWKLDFCGIKGQPELTDHFCTMDIAEAFLNDPYDWEGPKRSIVCSTEADMDAALTMQILTALSDTPVLFADVRHYHSELDIWDLCNSGQHATWFAARSGDPEENMRGVHLYPEEFYFPAGGASVHHLAAPGEMTFARLSRLDGSYRMQVMRGEFAQFDEVTNQRLMKASTFVWPHAFARLGAPAEQILTRYGSNHIHAVPGDQVDALRNVCGLLRIEYDGLGSAA
jgi:L-fucose/D-arabinose isomerase